MDKLIFIVDDEPSILKLLTHWVRNQWHYTVKTFENGQECLDSLDDHPDLILLDIMLPDIHGNEVLKRIKQYNENLPVIMLSAQGSIEVALDSIRQGAFDYFPKPIDKNRLEPAIKNAIQNYDLHRRVNQLTEDLQSEYSFDNIISGDRKMQDVFKLVSKVLNNDITVLINGESGTGKELVARAIHYNGIRKDKPFVVVNCASIPRELLESELFGHEKGSFTGAHQRKIGKFEVANGGTLFLDEIGEMEMSLQAKILRVIQQKEFERVGGNEEIKTDVRIISATNRDLKQAVDDKEFREDLYYRLSSFPITIPPLRERRGDIVLLVEHFLEVFNKKLGRSIKGIGKSTLKQLYDYDWPGNVRELENTLERCMILTDTNLIMPDSLPPQIKESEGNQSIPANAQLFTDEAPVVPIEKLKEEAVKHALKVTNGNIVDAAKKLKVGRATFYRMMEKYKMESKKD
ncbi:MAG: sigma-54 dependent transcriptional regulator [Melioribacteraceae bacterium]|nr:sigma-54 dependent transcriptional regulator [Melioribacteraceae bacterium]MCF8356505.1 sigma-54 dependent transcriptional regulator [Melioribacteraceae bacterium]MCF8395893.1 sigma-54 dependent transcriptional regulator [Melioribacteraceae bacterium]MCF8420944.1 sigma-54 dependent transcriptional regulator [Melioribacteraceae bacterium]